MGADAFALKVSMSALPLITQIAPAATATGRPVATAAAGGKVVLFYSAYEGPVLGRPLCLLSLAAALLKKGYELVVIDEVITGNLRGRIIAACANASCFGISVLIGPMLARVTDRLVSRRSLITGVPLPTESAEAC
jgi:hypothetical protein